MPEGISMIDWALRLAVAALLSGLIGFERETRQKAAGLRTHMLVGLGAALFTLVGANAFEGDTSRVSAQIVTGVGFLGAGAIFRQGATVRGLTTAAGLWAVAAIGMTTGAGLVSGAIVATGITLVILYGLGIMERAMRRRANAGQVRPVGIIIDNLSELDDVIMLASSIDEHAHQAGIERLDDRRFMVAFDIKADKIESVSTAVLGLESVVEVSELDPD